MTSTVAPRLWESAFATRQVAVAGEAATVEATLDQAITRLWETVIGHRQASCPICEGPMRPRYDAAAQPVGGRCAECGSSLS